MAPPNKLVLPYGFKDAKVLLLAQSIVGEFLQGETAIAHRCNCCCSCMHAFLSDVQQCRVAGGLIFGWNALAIMLKQQGNYTRNCTQAIEGEATRSFPGHSPLGTMAGSPHSSEARCVVANVSP